MSSLPGSPIPVSSRVCCAYGFKLYDRIQATFQDISEQVSSSSAESNGTTHDDCPNCAALVAGVYNLYATACLENTYNFYTLVKDDGSWTETYCDGASSRIYVLGYISIATTGIITVYIKVQSYVGTVLYLGYATIVNDAMTITPVAYNVDCPLKMVSLALRECDGDGGSDSSSSSILSSSSSISSSSSETPPESSSSSSSIPSSSSSSSGSCHCGECGDVDSQMTISVTPAASTYYGVSQTLTYNAAECAWVASTYAGSASGYKLWYKFYCAYDDNDPDGWYLEISIRGSLDTTVYDSIRLYPESGATCSPPSWTFSVLGSDLPVPSTAAIAGLDPDATYVFTITG